MYYKYFANMCEPQLIITQVTGHKSHNPSYSVVSKLIGAKLTRGAIALENFIAIAIINKCPLIGRFCYFCLFQAAELFYTITKVTNTFLLHIQLVPPREVKKSRQGIQHLLQLRMKTSMNKPTCLGDHQNVLIDVFSLIRTRTWSNAVCYRKPTHILRKRERERDPSRVIVGRKTKFSYV